ncbi:MAG: acyl-CoA thioesterase [Planctomycetota bacterium]|nr:acyl-CoA thioesterase [Planctomycetota bacterium]
MPVFHSFSYRVYYGDTDRMDRVYYANYFGICERARGELMRDAGFPYREIENRGWFFPVRKCHARYYGYAVYDDLLICQTRVSSLKHATLAFATDIFRRGGDKPLVSVVVELACVRADGKPDVIPPDLKAAMVRYAEE